MPSIDGATRPRSGDTGSTVTSRAQPPVTRRFRGSEGEFEVRDYASIGIGGGQQVRILALQGYVIGSEDRRAPVAADRLDISVLFGPCHNRLTFQFTRYDDSRSGSGRKRQNSGATIRKALVHALQNSHSGIVAPPTSSLYSRSVETECSVRQLTLRVLLAMGDGVGRRTSLDSKMSTQRLCKRTTGNRNTMNCLGRKPEASRCPDRPFGAVMSGP